MEKEEQEQKAREIWLKVYGQLACQESCPILHKIIFTITEAGKITVKASQTGNTYYGKAPEVTQTFCVNPVASITAESNSLTAAAATYY